MITAEQIKRVCPKAEPFTGGIQQAAERFNISTPLRLAHFLAQCSHESAGFTARSENLNYSASALRGVFGKYFPTDALANEYARKPERIAARVYGSRMGNGPEATGDGWKFRGRGVIQLTGHDNYAAFSRAVYGDDRMVKTPELVSSNPDAVLSAGWFWSSRSLNAAADRDDAAAVTKLVNGGSIGLEDRVKWLAKWKAVLL